AQEVTFMMLRVVLFEIYRRYRLRLAPGAAVTKNTVVTTKPAAVPVIRQPREQVGPRRSSAAHDSAAAPPAAPPAPPAPPRAPPPPPRPPPPAPPLSPPPPAPAAHPGGGAPPEPPATSTYRHVVIAYGSNFGANKELAERFAERSRFHGYTSDTITLDELA